MKKIPGNLLKNLDKSWKYHGILSVRKSGNPDKKWHYERLVEMLDLDLFCDIKMTSLGFYVP